MMPKFLGLCGVWELFSTSQGYQRGKHTLAVLLLMRVCSWDVFLPQMGLEVANELALWIFFRFCDVWLQLELGIKRSSRAGRGVLHVGYAVYRRRD